MWRTSASYGQKQYYNNKHTGEMMLAKRKKEISPE